MGDSKKWGDNCPPLPPRFCGLCAQCSVAVADANLESESADGRGFRIGWSPHLWRGGIVTLIWATRSSVVIIHTLNWGTFVMIVMWHSQPPLHHRSLYGEPTVKKELKLLNLIEQHMVLTSGEHNGKMNRQRWAPFALSECPAAAFCGYSNLRGTSGVYWAP